MLRYIAVPLIVLLFASSLFASRQEHPLNVKLNVKEPAGYNSSVEFEVQLNINQELLTPDFKESDIEMKVFLPEALRLRSGTKNWSGRLNLGLNETFSFNVRPALRQNLIYDIAVVLDSKDWYEPLIITKSLYLEETRGVVFEDNIIPQLLKNPWLMEAIGASETNIVDMSGNKRRAMTVNVDKLQPSVDDEAEWRKARPNRLHSEEYLRFLKVPIAILGKELPEESSKVKDNSKSHLASAIGQIEGYVRNSYGGIKDVLVVAYTLDGQDTVALGSTYTTTDTVTLGGYFFLEIDENAINSIVDDYVAIVAYTENSKGEPVQYYSGGNFYTYSIVKDDPVYSYSQQWDRHYWYFGVARFNNVSTQYDNAAQVCRHLIYTRTKTYTAGGYDAPDLYRVYFPYDIYPGYSFYGASVIYINSDHAGNHRIMGHEFGHHVDRYKTGSVGGADRSCDLAGSENEALGDDAWGDFYGIWAADTWSDTYDGFGTVSPYCGNTGPRVPWRVFGALYDLLDDRNDGETCTLSMSNILQYGLVTGADSIRAILNNLAAQFPGDSAAINDVKELNEITDGSWLLASVQEEVKYPAASLNHSLLQNTPNPFNPSTTISYEIGGNSSASVSLKIFDVRGREIANLVSAIREPGSYQVFWNGENKSGAKVPSGVYIYRLRINDYTETRKMVLLK